VRNIWTIFRKEIRSYFSSPVAYMLLTVYALIFGVIFVILVYSGARETMESQLRGQAMPFNVNERVIEPLLGLMSTVGLFFLPLVTMRLFAEEKRSGTIELLVTSPVHDYQIIVAKWLSALALYGALLGVASLNLLALFRYSHPDWKPLLIAYLGLLLEAGGMLAIGTFISSLTRNQIIAAAMTFGVLIILLFTSNLSNFDSSTTFSVLAYLSLTMHFDSFLKGVVETKDLIYYVSVIFLALFLTSRSLESLRWRS